MQETKSLRQIVLEIREEEEKNDTRFQELIEKEYSDTCTLNSKERNELDKLYKNYDKDNFYRNFLRYAKNIFLYNSPFVEEEKDNYDIPQNEVWLVKTILKEYMSPFLKISRSKRNSTISFVEFNNFIENIENVIREEFKTENERNTQLVLLNLYTDYERRRMVYNIKKDVELTISEDWKLLQRLENTQLKLSLLEEYQRAIKDFSERWKEEIYRQLEIEEEVLNELIEKEMNEVIKTDTSQISIPYSEEENDDLTDILTDKDRMEMDSRLMKWYQILKYRKDE